MTKGRRVWWAFFLLLSDPQQAEASLKECWTQRLQQVRRGASIESVTIRARERLLQAYRRPRFLWNESTTKALLTEAQRAGQEGLHLPAGHLEALQSLQNSHSACSREDRDLIASDLYLILGSHLAQGQVSPRRVDPGWRRRRRRRPVDGLLEGPLREASLQRNLRALRPNNPEYPRLVDALKRLRAGLPGWSAPPESTDEIAQDPDRMAVWLRERLSFEPEAVGLSKTSGDPAWKKALRSVQTRYGLPDHGRPDSLTLRALAVPLERRISQVEANLERLRWLDDAESSGPPHPLRIQVALAAKELRLIRPGQPDQVFPIAFGRSTRRTPVMQAQLFHFNLNPSWIVPRRVARQDLLPRILENPEYLPENHIRTYLLRETGWERVKGVDLDWPRIAALRRPFRLVQVPGPKNYLGKVKFVLPDAQGIYIHGGPPDRPFESGPSSAGCIRVEDPLSLARSLVRDDPAWPANRLERAAASGREVKVELSQPLPVRIVYRTAWVDEYGWLQFREDVYGRDPAITAAIRQLSQRGARWSTTSREPRSDQSSSAATRWRNVQ